MTNKDLDYLKDAFNWNLNCYKVISSISSKVTKKELENVLKNITDISYQNMNDINNYLKESLNE